MTLVQGRTLLSLILVPLAWSLPQTIAVNRNAKECLYDLIDEGEKVTASVFILSGAELRGGLLLEGPLSRNNITSGVELQGVIDNFERSKQTVGHGFQRIEKIVNFERLAPMRLEQSEAEEDDDDDDTETPNLDDEKLSEEEVERRIQERRQHARTARKIALEARRRRDERMRAQDVMNDGEAIQKTITATSKGWYRACVKGNWYPITAELEMRKESDLGGFDPDTGHVHSYSKSNEIEEKNYLEEDSASLEEGAIKDEDFATVKGQMLRLRSLLSLIQQYQSTERRRLTVHAATSEHSHSRMVLSNVLETILFMAVTGFQIYTIRKWFKGQVLVK